MHLFKSLACLSIVYGIKIKNSRVVEVLGGNYNILGKNFLTKKDKE